MLKIFTSINEAENNNYKVETDIDAMFGLKSLNIENMYLDKYSVRILNDIEGMTSRNKDRIDGKFGNVSLYDISTGGKGCLLAVNNSDFIISADQLGDNCIRVLVDIANDLDIAIVYTGITTVFNKEDEVIVDNTVEIGSDIIHAMEDAYIINNIDTEDEA